jgi:hypothetical protein
LCQKHENSSQSKELPMCITTKKLKHNSNHNESINMFSFKENYSKTKQSQKVCHQNTIRNVGGKLTKVRASSKTRIRLWIQTIINWRCIKHWFSAFLNKPIWKSYCDHTAATWKDSRIEHLHPSFEAPPQQIESSTLQPSAAGQC